MDTRAFSMARNLRTHAGAAALALVTVCGPSLANDGAERQLSIPFSALSASAQQEILLLQQGLRDSTVAAPVTMSTVDPGLVDFGSVGEASPVFSDDRRPRISWAIGVYR